MIKLVITGFKATSHPNIQPKGNIFQLTLAISNPCPSPSMMFFAGTQTF